MNDLISRKALLAEYDRVHVGEPGKARKLIADAPTIDAVEVVRCKDCKHYTDIESRCDHPMQGAEWCYDCWIAMEPNDFCSCGERKDNE